MATSTPLAATSMPTPITLLNPTTITLSLLSCLLIPCFFVKPGPLLQWLDRKRYQYEVTFALYMLTSTEKFIFNSLLFLLLAITSVAMGLYLPNHLLTMAGRMYYYINGDGSS